MIRYVQTDETGRILVTVANKAYTDKTYFEFDFPDDFDFGNQYEYLIADSQLIHYPKPPSEEDVVQTNDQRSSQMETATLMFIRASAPTLSDDEALSVSLLFEEWSENGRYAKGDIRQYNNAIYRCLSDHDGQASWTPDQSHSLWVRIRPESGILDWELVQPGINEPYKKGDEVTHNGKTWISDLDGNIWEPGVYGWTEDSGTAPYSDSETDPEPEPEPSPADPDEWKQPSGGHDAYKIGDRVKFKGDIYEPTIDNNVWSPEAYPQGWKQI